MLDCQEEVKIPKLKAVGLDRIYIIASVASTPPSLQFAVKSKAQLQKDVRIAVLGASGYTGSEVCCSCLRVDMHVHAEIDTSCGNFFLEVIVFSVFNSLLVVVLQKPLNQHVCSATLVYVDGYSAVLWTVVVYPSC